MASIIVKRPFVFNRPAAHTGIRSDGSRTVSLRPQQVFFRPGVHEVDDDIANHPYIAKHFADGCIESPQETQARAEKNKREAEEARARAKRLLAHAGEALTRHAVIDDVDSPVGTKVEKPSERASAEAPAPPAPAELNAPTRWATPPPAGTALTPAEQAIREELAGKTSEPPPPASEAPAKGGKVAARAAQAPVRRS